MCTTFKIEDLKQNIIYFNESICPKCNDKLNTSPLRKTKCPSCKEFIYSKKHPIYKDKMLLSEADLMEFSKYDFINQSLDIKIVHAVNKWDLESLLFSIDLSPEQYDHIKSTNIDLNEIDLLIELSKKSCDRYLKEFNLGLYRNCLLSISKLYYTDFKFDVALNYMNQVAYLDINGAENNMESLDLSTSISNNQVYPSILIKIICLHLLEFKKITLDDIKYNFKKQEVNNHLHYAVKLDQAWDKLAGAFETEIYNFTNQIV